MAVEHLSLAFRFFTVCWLGYVLYYSNVHSCQVKWKQACSGSGRRGLQQLFTFHMVIAGDSFYSEQIVFHWLMGLSCFNLGSDEFCFHLESKICSELLASWGVTVCLFVYSDVWYTCSGTLVPFWQQVLNLPKHNMWSLPRSLLFLIDGRERLTQGQRSISENPTPTKLSQIDFPSRLKSSCSQADIFSSRVRLAHTNIPGEHQTVEC